MFASGIYAVTHDLKDPNKKYTLKGKSLFIGLIVFFLCFAWLVCITFPAAVVQKFVSSQQANRFTIIWIVVLGACYQYTRWIKQVTNNNDPANQDTRTGYLDAIKTLIAAAGVAIAIIFTGTGKLASDDWLFIPQRAAILLALSMILAVCTLFALNVFYDETRTVASTGTPITNPVKWERLRFAVLIFYFALVSFLMGFAYLARLPFHIKLNP